MHQIIVEYEGELRTKAKHLQSGNEIITDAPVDNHGKGESFSPTDLLATSMLTCIMTIIGIRAEKRKLDVEGMVGNVEKIMTSNPRRVGSLSIRIILPKNIGKKDREWLIKEGCSCPVCFSVSESMNVEIIFED